MRKLTVVLALGLVMCLTALADTAKTPTLPTFDQPKFGDKAPYPVIGVADGDTFSVKGPLGPVTVRLIGVDTPETVHPSKPVQRYGKEASTFLANMLKGESVYLLFDGTEPQTGTYGRLLAYVYRAPDGLFVNAEIIRQGYGHAYTQFPFKHLDKFRQLEAFAKQASKGLWGLSEEAAKAPEPTPKPEYRPAPKREAPQASETVTVYVTKTGTKYHREGCRYLRRSKIPMPLEEAKRRYSPCSVCGPPR